MLQTNDGAVRFANTSDLDRYLNKVAAATPFQLLGSELKSDRGVAAPEVDAVGRNEAFEESLFLGLRLVEGVDLNNLRNQFGDAMLKDAMPALLEVCDAGLLELNADRVRLTPQGRLVSNEVFSRLLVTAAA